VRVHLLPDPISDCRVGDLETADAGDLFRRLLAKGLAPASVQSVRRTLRAALNAHPRLKFNIAKAAAGPRAPRPAVAKGKLWTHGQARRFLSHADAHDVDLAVLVRLALDTGARLGELLALRWSDIDPAGQVVATTRTVSAERMPGGEAKLRFDSPKSGKPRKIDVDASTMEALGRLRDRQAAEPVADVAQLVFRRPTTLGFQPWRPDSTTHTFQRLAKAAGVPVVPFHYLRHACASWLLEAGLDVVSVSEGLGHWSPDLTLRVYSHALPGRQRELARAIGAALS